MTELKNVGFLSPGMKLYVEREDIHALTSGVIAPFEQAAVTSSVRSCSLAILIVGHKAQRFL